MRARFPQCRARSPIRGNQQLYRVNIKVSIIKDDAGLRNSLAVLISGSPGYRLVSVHANAEDALKHIPLATPNVALVGITLPKCRVSNACGD